MLDLIHVRHYHQNIASQRQFNPCEIYCTACNISIMDGDFDNVTDELVYVGPKCNKLKPRFNPMI